MTLRVVREDGSMEGRAQVHFLNVGWGDAHLIRLPSGAVVLIDGGDGAETPGRDHPLRWLKRHGVRELDWMILTHIHEDHLNGLLDVARSLRVVRAVLPYELPRQRLEEALRARPPETPAEADMPARVAAMLQNYEALVRLLRAQGAEIHWRSEYGADGKTAVVAEEGGFELTHLYPWNGDPQPAFALLRRLAEDGPAEAAAAASAVDPELARFFELSNDDSSVYRLARRGETEGGVLFGGDLLHAGWQRLAGRADLRSRIWKVPHHGLEDAFTADMLSLVRPEIGVIPICVPRSLPFAGRWERMGREADAVLLRTGEAQAGERVRLTTGPIEAWLGG